jgi:hypothetical protein
MLTVKSIARGCRYRAADTSQAADADQQTRHGMTQKTLRLENDAIRPKPKIKELGGGRG